MAFLSISNTSSDRDGVLVEILQVVLVSIRDLHKKSVHVYNSLQATDEIPL
jgi:hypothetical protein